MGGTSSAGAECGRREAESGTAFARFAQCCDELAATSKRTAKRDLLAAFLLELRPEEVAHAALYVVGRAFSEGSKRTLEFKGPQLSVVVKSVAGSPSPSARERMAASADYGDAVEILWTDAHGAGRLTVPERPLALPEVAAAFAQIAAASGKGSQQARRGRLAELLAAASPAEAKWLSKLVIGEMRHGVNEGLLLESLAKAGDLKPRQVRRANMFLGDLVDLAMLVCTQGAEGLRHLRLQPFRPVKPMLASTCGSMAEAFAAHEGSLALEYKLDGARVQVHKADGVVRIYSRRLSEVTVGLPDTAAAVARGLRAGKAIVEGELVALDADGRPLLFQDVMHRFGRVHNVEETARQLPVELRLFDALQVEDESLVDSPYEERWSRLEMIARGVEVVERLIPGSLEEGTRFFDRAVAEGHEGVMAKLLTSTYSPGSRGKAWLKLKRIHTLDLALVAADWGYGRRKGWLSNYHLAVRDPKARRFLEVGKTFKGLTDAEFDEMTRRLLALKTDQRGGTVFVRPEIVVEVLFNDVQKSPQYECGMALRFARIARVREDKMPEECDTLETLTRLFESQFVTEEPSE